jgi:glycosyltransferase involved in cell wall biosynthesis
MKLCIIIPAYNEENRIGATLEKYGTYFDSKINDDFDYEMLIVINNTTDNTEDVIKKYQKRFKKIKYIRFVRGGKGFAVTEGFKYALKNEFDLIGFVDADMATRPEEYYRLFENIGKYDGIIASRWKPGAVHNYSLKRKIFSKGFNFAIRSLVFLPHKDTQCGAKIFTSKAIGSIVDHIAMTEWAFDINILYLMKKNKFCIKEIATAWEDKDGSKINILRDTIKMFSAVLRLRLINSPFRIIVRAYDKLPDKIRVGAL